MNHSCQHCGTRYTEFVGHDGFCCNGCAQVYRLIRDEGLADYYAMQDRVGQPPKVNGEGLASTRWLKRKQETIESELELPHLLMSVDGMSCMGCAWLIEKLARSHPMIRSARVDLEANTVVLEWIPKAGDLAELVAEWARFGYLVREADGRVSHRLSPLLWRICLLVLFTTNAWLLGSLAKFGVDFADYQDLVQLLLWFVAVLGFFAGATFFVLPVYQSLRMRRLHYDALPSLGLLISYVAAAFGVHGFEWWSVLFLITVLLFARWVHRLQWQRFATRGDTVDARMQLWLQVYVGVAVMAAVFLLLTQGAHVAVAALYASSLYPWARSVSCQAGVGYVCLIAGIGVLGVSLGTVHGSPLLAGLWMLGSGVSINFLFLHFSFFKTTPVD